MAQKQFKNIGKAAMTLFRRESTMTKLRRRPWVAFGVVFGASLGAIGAALLMNERLRRTAEEAIGTGLGRLSETLKWARGDATEAVRSVAPRSPGDNHAAAH